MTTNKAYGNQPVNPLIPGLPDIAELTRLANQYFSTPASVEAIPSQTISAGSLDSRVQENILGDNFSKGNYLDTVDLKSIADSLVRNPANIQAQAAEPRFYFAEHLPSFSGTAAPIDIAAKHPPFDVHLARKDFPILKEKINGYPLAWLDNAATTQKPQAVIDRISKFYRRENSNIHRAAHELAARATDAYEQARDIVAKFINASSSDEIVFVRGSTEAINLVAKSWGKKHIGAGDEIVISWLEHHANIVPWQQLCKETGAILKVIPVDDSGQVLLHDYQQLLNGKTKLVAFTQVSNALGTITPAQEMIEMAHRVGARVLLDGAQSISHLAVDVQALNCDWFVFSGHKIYGPPASAHCTARPNCWRKARPGKAAAI